MIGYALLAAVTLFYAGYNLLIKLSGGHVPAAATTTVLATICLQIAALSTSLVFCAFLWMRDGQVFSLSAGAYGWAAAAGVCIGLAEVGYLYLFGGIGVGRPMEASIAIPAIVSGTVVLAILFSGLVLKEELSWHQIAGSGLVIAGIVLSFSKG